MGDILVGTNQQLPDGLKQRWADLGDGTYAPVIHDQDRYWASPVDHIYQSVDTVGNGTGTTEQATAAAIYKYVPPAGYIAVIERMNIYIEDNGKFRGDYYGATGALTNGIVVSINNANGDALKILTPQPVKSIGLWGLVAGVDVIVTDFVSGNDFFLIRWTFGRSGRPIYLDADLGHYLKINIQDNLGAGGAALVSHRMHLQGWRKAKLT